MTFREAEYDIKSRYDNSNDVVDCLKEMIRQANENIVGYVEVKPIALLYYKDIQDCRSKRMPKIELTDKELRQLKAFISIGTPIERIAVRMHYSKTVIHRGLREIGLR